MMIVMTVMNVCMFKETDITTISWGHHTSCLVFERELLLPELLKQQNEHNILSISACPLACMEVEEKKKKTTLYWSSF